MAYTLKPTTHDLGGLIVNRVLPQKQKRMIGPFIFFDHMGPSDFNPGEGINVRPHPHIGLSTLTYLFAGAILHRDSLGNHLEIQPGDVNWMTAGKGIVHSERETFEVRANPHHIDGLQCWIALPEHMAELSPSFQHVKKQALPCYIHEGIMMRLVVGEAYSMSSPVKTFSPMYYLDIAACKNSCIDRPYSDDECAVYVIAGEIRVAENTYTKGSFVVLEHEDTNFTFSAAGRAVLLGGKAFDTVPHIEWNFVSFSKDRIRQAVDDWRNGVFPTIPDDNQEHIEY